MSIRPECRPTPRALFLAAALGASLLVSDGRAQCPINPSAPSGPSGPSDSGSSGSSSGAAPSPWTGSTSAALTAGSGRRAANTGGGSNAASGPLYGATTGTRGQSLRNGAQRRTVCYTLPTEVDDPDRWTLWWDRNEDELLWSAATLPVSRAASTGATGPLTGRGRRAEADPNAPNRAEVYTRIVPELLALVDADPDPRLLDATLVALGQAVDPPFHDPVLDALPALLAHQDRTVQAAATLSLGLLGSPEATESLLALASCSTEGHHLVGASSVPPRLRSLAALALGYGNDPDAVQPLMDLIAKLPESESQTRAHAAMALGLMDNPAVGRAAAWMARQLSNRRLDPAVASALPVALARLGRPGAREALLAVLDDRDSDRWVVQSTAIALGRLGDLGDAEVLEALQDLVADAKDGPTRHFALISLARLGAADPSPATHREAHDDLAKLLADQVHDPDRRMDRPWAALAAGLYGRAQLEARPLLSGRLLEAYDDVNDVAERGAYALGLGLLGAAEAAPRLRADYGEVMDDGFRRHVATSLGLMGDDDAADILVGDLDREGMDPALRRSLGAALRLLGDGRARLVAARAFQDSDSLDTRLSAARSLAMLRDGRSVPMLAAAAGDEDLDALSRASACAALGRVIEKTTLPWYARACIDSNFTVPTGALEEVLALR